MFIKIKDYRIDKAYISSYEPYENDEGYGIFIRMYRDEYPIRINYGKGEAGRKQRDEDIALLDRELLNKDK